MKFSGEITMELLAEIYPKAAQACKDSEERMEQARAATKKLQDGDREYTKRWREFIDVSIAGMKANFDALGVHFDEWKGESDAHPYIEKMVTDYKGNGFASDSDGALIVPVSQVSDKKEIPPLILPLNPMVRCSTARRIWRRLLIVCMCTSRRRLFMLLISVSTCISSRCFAQRRLAVL